MRSPVIKQWGKPRPLHKYLTRHWDAARQDWHYVYPQTVGSAGGGNDDGPPDEGPRRQVAQEELSYRREHSMAQDMDSQVHTNEHREADEKEADGHGDEFLEGFEEGYEIGKKVGAKEADEE